MEGIALETLPFNATIAAAGAFILLAVFLGVVLLGYVAEEETKGRRLIWAEEPLPEAGKPALPDAQQFRRAA